MHYMPETIVIFTCSSETQSRNRNRKSENYETMYIITDRANLGEVGEFFPKNKSSQSSSVWYNSSVHVIIIFWLFNTSVCLTKKFTVQISKWQIFNDLHINKATNTSSTPHSDEKLKEYIIRYSPIWMATVMDCLSHVKQKKIQLIFYFLVSHSKNTPKIWGIFNSCCRFLFMFVIRMR